jgi:hypothetical protein
MRLGALLFLVSFKLTFIFARRCFEDLLMTLLIDWLKKRVWQWKLRTLPSQLLPRRDWGLRIDQRWHYVRYDGDCESPWVFRVVEEWIPRYRRQVHDGQR